MKKNSGAAHKPRLYISCGTADFLYYQQDPFVQALEENGWNVTASETEGATHEWGFWDDQIRAFIDFIYDTND